MDSEKNRREHKSFGIISFSRASSTSAKPLFGSSLKHGNTIRMRLSHAQEERDLNTDWIRPTGLIAEVEMSGSQFAELITSMNMGEGVPCTIRWLNGETVDDPPYEDKSELHRKEFAKHQDDILASAENVLAMTKELFEKKSLTKADKETIINHLKKLCVNIGPNTNYQVTMFDEQMAKSVTEAKNEIETFYMNKIISLGNQALVENGDIPKLSQTSPIDISSIETDKGDTPK